MVCRNLSPEQQGLSDVCSMLVVSKEVSVLSVLKENWEFKKPVWFGLRLQCFGALWELYNSQGFSVVLVVSISISLL